MKRIFFDSSAFAKRFIQEPGTSAVEQLCTSADEIGLSAICSPEIFSALNRLRREHYLDSEAYFRTKRQFVEELSDILIINITPEVVSRSTALLEKHRLRAMDAIHIACALEWMPDLFVTSDSRQYAAATKAGLRTKLIR